MPKIYVAVSAHGFGHLGQVSPVLNRLSQWYPELKLTLQTDLPEGLVASRVDGNFKLVSCAADIGVLMDGPTVIRWPETIAAHQQFHADWSAYFSRQLDYLMAAEPDLVISDVPYLTIAAAKALRIPVVVFCSLNWADILAAHSPALEHLSSELETMRSCYQSADVFIQPEPSMSMPWLSNRRAVGAVFRQGRSQRHEINQRLGLGNGQKLVLVGLGGIPETQRVRAWPELPGIHWIVPGTASHGRADVHSLDALAMHFTSVLSSVDLIVSKPGYGTYTEVAGAGIPMISIERSDWAETKALDPWLTSLVPFRTIPLARYLDGDYGQLIRELLDLPKAQPIAPAGIEEALVIIRGLLQKNRTGIE